MNFVRPLLIAVVLLMVLFAACITLIRAQPYDDSELRAFLAPPDDCPMPCFLGIRPGVTTLEETVGILEAHEWIGLVSSFEATEGRGVVFVTASWSGRQPDFIDSDAALWLGVNDETIESIFIPTRIPLGYIWLLYGAPSYSDVVDTPSAQYDGIYFDLPSAFMSEAVCPIDSVWMLPVQWVLWDALNAAHIPESHDPPVQMYSVCRGIVKDR